MLTPAMVGETLRRLSELVSASIAKARNRPKENGIPDGVSAVAAEMQRATRGWGTGSVAGFEARLGHDRLH